MKARCFVLHALSVLCTAATGFVSSGCSENDEPPPSQGVAGQVGAAGDGVGGDEGGAENDGSGAGGADGGGAENSGSSGGGASGSGSGSELEPLPSVARVMAVGDSITRATCWRALLWERLNQSFAGRFDFVGTLQSDNGCMPSAHDRDNQGYSSSLITEIVAGITTRMGCDPAPCPTLEQLQTAFTTATPDVVLMHFGTNDVWNGIAPGGIISAYTAVLGALRAANPNVRVLVAQIIPMNVTEMTCTGCTCAGCPTAIPELNTQIAAWAAENATAASPIYVVDQWTGFDPTVDTGDGVHPNLAGSQKMADNWFEAIEPHFAAVP